MMYGLIYGLELFNIMNRTELGILFISAICHDLVISLKIASIIS